MKSFIWEENNTEVYTADKSKVVQKPLYKDGTPLGVFEDHDVILLKDFDCNKKNDKFFKKGQQFIAHLTPSGKIDISRVVSGIYCSVKSDAKPGVDFDWL